MNVYQISKTPNRVLTRKKSLKMKPTRVEPEGREKGENYNVVTKLPRAGKKRVGRS